MLDRGEQYSCLWDLRASRIAPELLLFARMAGPLQLSVLTPLAAAPRLSVRLALGSAVPYAWRDRCGLLC